MVKEKIMYDYTLEQCIADTLEIGVGLSSYQETDYDRVMQVLIQNGWKPVNCRRPRSRRARQIMATYDTFQTFYNCATKNKFAFLGYHTVTYYDTDRKPSEHRYELWLRILGDNE